ncbi:MAG: hypothetical protein QG608_1121 [Actinomycetota bacterium]|nr:hypothetical protein [Actinomycetota bacterium]
MTDPARLPVLTSKGALRVFIALLLSRSSSDRPGYRPLWQEDMVLIRATSLPEGKARAKARGERAQTSYANESGETITWTFDRVVDIAEALEDDLSGDADLYSRAFRNYQAYADFEPMLNGELE